MVECNDGSFDTIEEFKVFNDEKMFDISRVQVVRITYPFFEHQMKYFYIYHMGMHVFHWINVCVDSLQYLGSVAVNLSFYRDCESGQALALAKCEVVKPAFDRRHFHMKFYRWQVAMNCTPDTKLLDTATSYSYVIRYIRKIM